MADQIDTQQDAEEGVECVIDHRDIKEQVEDNAIVNCESDTDEQQKDEAYIEMKAKDHSEIERLANGFCACTLCNQTLMLPKSLQCLHTFCRDCLIEHIIDELENRETKDEFIFHCPVCQDTVELPKDSTPYTYVRTLRENTVIMRLVEVIRAYGEDKTCSVCERGEIRTPAINWCIDCYDSMCANCTQVHLYGRFTSDHVVSTLEEIRSLPLDYVMRSKRDIPCDKHPGEIIKMYCVDCKELLCVHCVALDHRKCQECMTVAEAVTAYEEDVQDTMTTLGVIDSSIDNIDGIKVAELNLEATVEETRRKIKSTAEDLCQRLREQEKVMLQKLDKVQQDERKHLDEMLLKQKVKKHSLRSAQETMQNLMLYGSSVEVLIFVNQIKDNIEKFYETADALDMSQAVSKLSFEKDESVDRFSRDFEELGEIQITEDSAENIPPAWGVTFTRNEDMVVTDSRNKRIKKFDRSGRIVDEVQVSEEPIDITSVSGDDVAVTLKSKQIMFFSTVGTLQLKRRTLTEIQYDGIANSQLADHLVVTSISERCVDVISRRGDLLSSFRSDKDGTPLFLEPRYACATRDGPYIISDLVRNCVIGLSASGDLLFKYEPRGTRKLKRPLGLAMDHMKNIFIADAGGSKVHLLSREGEFQSMVLTKDNGITKPVAVAVSASNKMVIVQDDGMVKTFTCG